MIRALWGAELDPDDFDFDDTLYFARMKRLGLAAKWSLNAILMTLNGLIINMMGLKIKYSILFSFVQILIDPMHSEGEIRFFRVRAGEAEPLINQRISYKVRKRVCRKEMICRYSHDDTIWRFRERRLQFLGSFVRRILGFCR